MNIKGKPGSRFANFTTEFFDEFSAKREPKQSDIWAANIMKTLGWVVVGFFGSVLLLWLIMKFVAG